MTSIARQAFSHMLSVGVSVDEALSESELSAIEHRFGFRFGADHRELLSLALPMGGHWVDWRNERKADLRKRLNWPVDGVLFDVMNGEFWPPSWGLRPTKSSRASTVARRELAGWPALVPIHGHRYLAAAPATSGCVLSVHQTDVIFYGEDLLDYVHHEFGPKDASRPEHSRISSTVLPPWSLLAAGFEVG